MSEKKHLSTVPEGDEDSDSGQTILMALDQGAESAAAVSPSPQGISMNLSRHWASDAVLAVLDTVLHVDGCTTKIINWADGQPIDGPPSAELARAVDDAVARHALDLAQKRDLFSILRWEFVCLDCGMAKPAAHYDKSSFLLWSGPRKNLNVRLRSGPCMECKKEAKKGLREGAIVPYDP